MNTSTMGRGYRLILAAGTGTTLSLDQHLKRNCLGRKKKLCFDQIRVASKRPLLPF
jgi:hypothetical protein